MPRLTNTLGDVSCGFSDLESKLLKLVSEGHTNKQIARLLAIDTEAIEQMIDELLAKLGLTSKLAAAVWVIKQRPRLPHHSVRKAQGLKDGASE